MKHVLGGLLVVVAAMFSVNLVYAQGTEEPVVYTVTCFGSQDVCAEWHRPGSNVWHQIPGGRVYEDPYPFEFGRACPAGSTETDKIFLFDPGSGTTGVGYIGCQACINESANQHIIATQPTTQVFKDYQAWVNAQGPRP